MRNKYKGSNAAWWLILLQGAAIFMGGFVQALLMKRGFGEYTATALSQFTLIVPVAAGFLYLKYWYRYESASSLFAIRSFEPAMTFMLLILPEGARYFGTVVQLPFVEELIERYGEQVVITPPDSISTLLLAFVSLCIIAPILEELFFRGVIMKILEPYGMAVAVLFSAFGFAMLHFQPSVFIAIFIVGIVLGFVRIYSGSIFACMLFHSVFNFASLMELVFEKQMEALSSVLIIYVIGMFCLFPILCVVSYYCWGRKKGCRAVCTIHPAMIVPVLLCAAFYGVIVSI